MSASPTTRALDCVCGTVGVVLVVGGLVSALVTGCIAVVLTSEGVGFWAHLAWFVTLSCLLAPALFLHSYGQWARSKGLE